MEHTPEWKIMLLEKYNAPRKIIIQIEDYVHNHRIAEVYVVSSWYPPCFRNKKYNIYMLHQNGKIKKWKDPHRK